MTLKQYAKEINALLREHPDLADAPVCYSKDDEGNGYNETVFSPSVGKLDSGTWYTESDLEEDPESVGPTHVLIN